MRVLVVGFANSVHLSRFLRIFEGTDEMQRLIISRDLLRGYTKVGQ